jgi:hypothetical protein
VFPPATHRLSIDILGGVGQFPQRKLFGESLYYFVSVRYQVHFMGTWRGAGFPSTGPMFLLSVHVIGARTTGELIPRSHTIATPERPACDLPSVVRSNSSARPRLPCSPRSPSGDAGRECAAYGGHGLALHPSQCGRPPVTRHGRPRQVDRREVLHTLLYLNRRGCQGDMLPHDLLPKSTVYDYVAQQCDDGTWTNLERKIEELGGM